MENLVVTMLMLYAIVILCIAYGIRPTMFGYWGERDVYRKTKRLRKILMTTGYISAFVSLARIAVMVYG